MLEVTSLSLIHLAALLLLLIALLLGGWSLFYTTVQHTEQLKYRKVFIALQHTAFSLLVLSGIGLLIAQHFQLETWFYAKIILFLVMFSALSKAYKKHPSILLIQRKAGWGLAMLALIAIYALVLLQPRFG